MNFVHMVYFMHQQHPIHLLLLLTSWESYNLNSHMFFVITLIQTELDKPKTHKSQRYVPSKTFLIASKLQVYILP